VIDPGPVFAALADDTRRSLLDVLAERGEATATQLARELPITRQAVTKQLSTLGHAGLVESRREGRELRFRVLPAALEGAVAWITATGARWDARLRDLEAYLSHGGRAAP
jgi:DNA-binding transcriptional ArsR family regulator